MQRGLDVNQEAMARAADMSEATDGQKQQDARSFSEGLAAFEKHVEESEMLFPVRDRVSASCGLGLEDALSGFLWITLCLRSFC